MVCVAKGARKCSNVWSRNRLLYLDWEDRERLGSRRLVRVLLLCRWDRIMLFQVSVELLSPRVRAACSRKLGRA